MYSQQGVGVQQQSQQQHEEVKTLWVGDLQYWMDETYLHSCFVHTGEVRAMSPNGGALLLTVGLPCYATWRSVVEAISLLR